MRTKTVWLLAFLILVVLCFTACDTGKTSSQTVCEKNGHTEVIDPAVAPTCTETGLTEGKHCSVCNEVLVKQTVVEATGHRYTATLLAPTKTEGGYTTYTCTVCEYTYKDNYTPPIGSLGLSYTVNEDGKTCTVTGIGTCADTEIFISSINPEGYEVTAIGDNAFADCTAVTSILIPDSVTSIGQYAFHGTAYYDNDENWNNSVLYIGKHLIGAKDSVSGAYQIVSGTLTIAGGAFEYCSSLTSVTIPASVTSIGETAFYGCSSLTGVYITDLAAWCKIKFGNSAANPLYVAKNLYLNGELATDLVIPSDVTSIGWGAFWECSSLTSITIPSSVTSIDPFAFYNCSHLTDVTFGENSQLTSIGQYTFYGCSSLGSITIPGGVTSVGDWTFGVCSSLTSVTISDGVTSIGKDAFWGCSNLTSITIPESVTSIGKGAFWGCSRLTGITFGGTMAQWNAISKGIDWKYGTGAYTITCTDGVIRKENS